MQKSVAFLYMHNERRESKKKKKKKKNLKIMLKKIPRDKPDQRADRLIL